MKTTVCIPAFLHLFIHEGCLLLLLFASHTLSKKWKHFTMHSFPLFNITQIPAQLKRNNQGLHSSFYAYFKSYQGIHFSLFTVHFFKFTIIQLIGWGTEKGKCILLRDTYLGDLLLFKRQFQATLKQIYQQQWLMFYFQKRINLRLLVIFQSLPWTITNPSRYW